MGQRESNFDVTPTPSVARGTITGTVSRGTVIAQQFRIEEKLGDGGMGSVFKCTDLWLSRTVAVKLVHPHLASTPKSILRFRQEAKAAALLNHPGIVRLHQLSFDAEMPFIVMDYVEGKSLSQLLRENGTLNVPRTVAIMAKVADAVGHAHSHGVVHRDLKPSNILICADETIKVVDFGIAKIISADDSGSNVPTLTGTGEVFGSPPYMSPESLKGQVVDGRSDQYSFGCVLYECLTGAPPFTGANLIELLTRQVNDIPLSLRDASLGVDFPEWLEDVVTVILCKEPNDRFEDMESVRRALINQRRLFADPEPEFYQPVDLRPARRLNRVAIGSAAAVAFVAIAAGIYFVLSSNQGASHSVSLDSNDLPTRRQLVPDYKSHELRGDASVADEQFARLVLWQAGKGDFEVKKTPPTLSDQGLNCLRSMPSLTFLNLGRCVHISDQGMEVLLNVVRSKGFNLEGLSLNETFIKDGGLASVAQIHSLQKLYISNMTEISDPGFTAVTSLPRLSALSIEGDDQLSPHALQSLSVAKNLNWLNISDCPLNGVTASLTNLKLVYLDAQNCRLADDDMTQLAKIETLEQLNVSNNRNVSMTGLLELTKLKKLKRVNLPANGLPSESIVSFLEKMHGVAVTFDSKKF